MWTYLSDFSDAFASDSASVLSASVASWVFDDVPEAGVDEAPWLVAGRGFSDAAALAVSSWLAELSDTLADWGLF